MSYGDNGAPMAGKIPDFSKYTKDHWSFLLYIETRSVDHDGRIDPRHVNDADRDAAEDMESDGLLLWHGTGLNPIFSLTDAGWAVAHEMRRARAGGVGPERWPSLAAAAVERSNAGPATNREADSEGSECEMSGRAVAPKRMENIRQQILNRDDAENILDELVHELAAEVATEVNNGGLDEQIEFVREWAGSESKAVSAIQDFLASLDEIEE